MKMSNGLAGSWPAIDAYVVALGVLLAVRIGLCGIEQGQHAAPFYACQVKEPSYMSA